MSVSFVVPRDPMSREHEASLPAERRRGCSKWWPICFPPGGLVSSC